MKESILEDFDSIKPTLEDFKLKMEVLISELLKNDQVHTHQINGRLKERSSLAKKIDKKQDKYSIINDITDIVGLRIITYLESDVDKIAKIIEKEFIVDTDNSIDKRKLRSDQFGYRSFHFVASCLDDRTKLIEYKRFKNLKFEIQIRSILQHAWAEIEHDLGYKGISSIPDAHKRGFNRLAALLESADIEFDRLKKELIRYESEVGNLIQNNPETVTIDQASLTSFITSDEIILKALNIIKVNVKCEFSLDSDYRDFIDKFINLFEISTIESLKAKLEINEALFLEFINEFTQTVDYPVLSRSIVLYYFQHFLSALDENEEFVDKYLNFKNFKISSDAGRFIKTIKKAKAKLNKSGNTI